MLITLTEDFLVKWRTYSDFLQYSKRNILPSDSADLNFDSSFHHLRINVPLMPCFLAVTLLDPDALASSTNCNLKSRGYAERLFDLKGSEMYIKLTKNTDLFFIRFIS